MQQKAEGAGLLKKVLALLTAEVLVTALIPANVSAEEINTEAEEISAEANTETEEISAEANTETEDISAEANAESEDTSAEAGISEETAGSGAEEENGSISALQDGDYTIESGVGEGYMLNLENESSDNAANISLYEQTGGFGQIFHVAGAGGFYTITSDLSDKSVDVSGGGTSPGVNVQQYQSNGTKAQQFNISSSSRAGFYTIKAASGSAYLQRRTRRD